MESAICILHLDREVVFIAHFAAELLSVACRDGHSLDPPGRRRGISNRLSNLGSRQAPSVSRQVGADKSVLASNRVAGRAASFSHEDCLALLRVSCKRGRNTFALQDAQVIN